MKDDNKQTRRRFLKGTGGAATAVALAGCLGGGDGNGGGGNGGGGNGSGGNGGNGGGGGGGGNGGGQETQKEVKANPNATFQLVNSTITTFDPVASADTASGTVVQQLFDGLMNYPDGKATPVKGLAKSFELSDDQKTYTFKLKDAKFHNGDPVRAQDFVYSFKRLAGSENSERSYFILDSLGVQAETDDEGNANLDSLGVKADDDKTLEISLSEPFHAALEMLAYSSFAVTPEGIVGDIPGYDGDMPYQQFASSNPVGCGPFQFDSYQSGTSADIKKFENYHGKKAQIAGVHWQVIEKDSPAYNYSMEKNSDIISMPTAQYDPSKVKTSGGANDLGQKFGTYGPLRNNETAQYFSIPEISTYYIGFNMPKVPKAVRQAFAYVANQEQLVEQVFKGRGVPAYHLTPPSIFPGGAKAYEKNAKQNYPYSYNETDVEGAKKVMEDAGYGPNNKYTVQWTQYESDTWLEMAQQLQDQLRPAHINMKIQQADFSTLLERGTNGKLEVYTLGWIADWPAPDNFLQLLNPPQTDTSEAAPISYLNWNQVDSKASTQATNAYKKVANNLQPGKQAESTRDKAYLQIEQANWQDVGFLNLYHSLGERLWYDWVDIPPYGGMGGSRQMYNDVKIGKRN